MDDGKEFSNIISDCKLVGNIYDRLVAPLAIILGVCTKGLITINSNVHSLMALGIT